MCVCVFAWCAWYGDCGTVSLDAVLSYRCCAGAITNVSPSAGQAGTRVTITGTNLLSGGSNETVTVILAGVNATVMSANDTVILAVAVAANASIVLGDVAIVANTGGNTTISAVWMYLEPGDTIAARWDIVWMWCSGSSLIYVGSGWCGSVCAVR